MYEEQAVIDRLSYFCRNRIVVSLPRTVPRGTKPLLIPVKLSRLILLLSALALFSASRTSAQTVTASGSNLLRLGSGYQVDDADAEVRKRYFEEIANARIFFQNLSIGLRYEMDDPSEIGRSFQGLRRRWIQYKKDRVELQAGDVTALFGRGLTVNLFESRPLNYDTWLDGLYGQFEKLWSKEEHELRPSVAIQGVAGKLDFFDVIHEADDPDPDLRISARAINGEVGLFGRKLLIGGSFLQAFTEREVFIFGPKTNKREVNQPGAYINFFTGEFEGFFEWTEPRSSLSQYANQDTNVRRTGRALYGSLSYANESFGATVEFKDYKYNLYDPYGSFQDDFGKLPLSSPPEVYKENTYTSMTRMTHAVNFNDEIGAQVELNITAIEDFDITLNASAASRHTGYAEDTNSRLVKIGTANLFPGFEAAYAPFWEFYGEVDHQFNELDNIKLAVHRTSNYDNAYLKMATTVAAKTQIATSDDQSFQAIIEHQWVYDEGRTLEDKTFMNELITLQYSFSRFNFGGIYDFSTRYEKPHHIWAQGFLSVRIGDAHTALLSYGSERGGLNCTGGICRVVPAFEGLRFTLTSQI